MKSTGQHRNQAVVAVIQRDHQLLTIRRSNAVIAPGQYCFPGGGIEPGESAEAAIVREMQEELSILIDPVNPFWNSITPSGIELSWWAANIRSGQTIIPNPAEVASYHWLSVAQIRSLPNLLISNVEFFQSLDRGEFELP